MAVPNSEAVQWLPSGSTSAESRSGRIGPIILEAKQTGERSAGNPHAAFDEAGAGNVARPRSCDTSRRKSEPTGNTNFGLNRRASPLTTRLASKAASVMEMRTMILLKSVSMKSQQEIERHYFEQFRKASGLEAIPAYGDKPDVILHLDLKTGVEITNFYLRPGHDPASEQRQRKRRQDVVAEAQKRYRNTGGRWFELTIQFDNKRPIGSGRRAALIGELVGLARRIEDHPTGPVSPVLFEQSPELLTVWLNAQEYLDAVWSVSQVYTLDILSPQALSEIIREKEAKASGYQSCDAYIGFWSSSIGRIRPKIRRSLSALSLLCRTCSSGSFSTCPALTKSLRPSRKRPVKAEKLRLASLGDTGG